MSSIEILNSVEKEAWESFEVGSFSDVKDFLKHSDSSFLKNLIIISEWEDRKRINPNAKPFPEPVLQDMTRAYLEFIWGKKQNALNSLKQYSQKKSPLFSLTFLSFGLRVGLEQEDYEFTLFWMSLANKEYESYFCKEKIHCLYGLKRYSELLTYFKTVFKFVDKDPDIMLKVGLTLQALGKYKESEFLLEKIEDKPQLPSFENRKEDFKELISKIPLLEKKKDSLSFEELKNLGFAYLFNSQYDEAEKIFKQATLTTV
ncbi:MAG: hypothetical protein SFU98_16215 [Leptospiraceae bacterium]|nr:hypothetical protein [Leptospiraceae bacterium]